MTFAYFMNAYPMTSTTFIRREIEAHERAGFDVRRYAIRPWDQKLVDPKDIEEENRTFYILRQGSLSMVKRFLRELFSNPVGLVRGFGMAVKLMRVASGKRLLQFAYFLEAIVLKQQTALDGIDHLHTHFSTNSATVALLAHKMGGPRYSMTIHGPDELFEMKENGLVEKVRHARFVVAITQYCRDVVDAETAGQFSDKIHIVHCGLDMSEFEQPDNVPDNKTLICVGRLCKAKAQTLLIEALHQIVEKHPDVILVLIGDGEERPAVEDAIARLDLQDYVEMVGWKSNSEVHQALRQNRAMVLPSLAEGLPIVIMESFALGRPVVTTRICGIPELVDASCGWLADPGDVETLVDCLDAVLSKSPDELTKMGMIGRNRVLESHDQNKSSEQLRNLISQ